jgi:hypothetical protein
MPSGDTLSVRPDPVTFGAPTLEAPCDHIPRNAVSHYALLSDLGQGHFPTQGIGLPQNRQRSLDFRIASSAAALELWRGVHAMSYSFVSTFVGVCLIWILRLHDAPPMSPMKRRTATIAISTDGLILVEQSW